MFPLYRDRWYTFRFAEARRIPAFHLEDAREGAGVAVFRADPGTGLPSDRLTDSVVGPGGWVQFAPDLIVAAGDVLLAEVDGWDRRLAGPGKTGETPVPPNSTEVQ